MSERRVWQRVRAEGMGQDRGRTRAQQAHGVGEEGRRGRAVTLQSTLHRRAIIFTMPAGAIEVFVPHLGGGAASEVTTKRGFSPALLTSALSTTRQGRDHDAAAASHAS